MALNETDKRRSCSETRTIEDLASALDIGIMIYDRNDTLIAASSHLLRYFDVNPELLQPGARLRDLFNATYDAGGSSLGALNGKDRYISREDWIAERIAIHWRERYESVEKLADGRWIRLRKRRMPDGILITTSEDITDQKKNSEEMAAVLKKAELVQVILDNLANPVTVKDSELRYVMVNEAFCRIPGLHRKQILGKKAGDLVGPELAARFEKIEASVLQTGVPFEVLEDIVKADGTVMHVVTRVRRSGTPGNYHITVSFDDVGALAEGKKVASDYRRSAKPAAAVANSSDETLSRPEPKGRVLVLDEDCQRSSDRAIALKRAGFDAVAVASAEEAIAFLDAARSMKLTIDEVEISAALARSLSGMVFSARHDVLKRAIEQKVSSEALGRAETLSASRKTGTSQTPVLSVVASTPEPKAPVIARSDQASSTIAPSVVQLIKAAPVRIRVLVAEDNDVNQIVFEQILEGIGGVDYRIVSNGEEAVAAWTAAQLDLILMDVSMPVMNGLQATQAIRDAETAQPGKTARVPIIAVTAHAMTGDRERCLAAGMDDYLSKPVSPEKLESIIQKWVDNSARFLDAG